MFFDSIKLMSVSASDRLIEYMMDKHWGNLEGVVTSLVNYAAFVCVSILASMLVLLQLVTIDGLAGRVLLFATCTDVLFDF